MGMQYAIAKRHIDKNSTNGKLRAETINSYGHAGAKSFSDPDMLRYTSAGDVIIEVVGVVKVRPIIEKQPLPWTVGEIYGGKNGHSKWKLIAILPDRLVFENSITLNAHFTKPDGGSWKDGLTGIRLNYEDVEVGTEKYLDKENV